MKQLWPKKWPKHTAVIIVMHRASQHPKKQTNPIFFYDLHQYRKMTVDHLLKVQNSMLKRKSKWSWGSITWLKTHYPVWGNLFGPVRHKARHKQEQKREYWRPIKENICYKNNKIPYNVRIQIVKKLLSLKNFIQYFKLKTAKRPVVRPANYAVWWHKE